MTDCIKPGDEYIVRIDAMLEGDPVGKLVRCRDCNRNSYCYTFRQTGDDDGFCAWAEERKMPPVDNIS